MTFERTQDYSLIRQIVTHPRIYKHIGDDGSPPAESYQPPQHDSFLYLLVYDQSELLGLFMFHPITSLCLELHTCLYPSAGFARAKQAGTGAIDWIWQHTGYTRIRTEVPEYNRPAFRLAVQSGFRAFGRDLACFPKHGRPCDLILLGISKPVCP